jgi:hypothetical protein|tara:strand:+ start:1646 stop:1852 length:207 start_codon:yes stop_codon:yes gene_type:complete
MSLTVTKDNLDNIIENFGSLKLSKGVNEEFVTVVIDKNRVHSTHDQNKVLLRLEPYEVERLCIMKEAS